MQCWDNVASTSMQRHDVASTLMRRCACINVMFPLGKVVRLHLSRSVWQRTFWHVRPTNKSACASANSDQSSLSAWKKKLCRFGYWKCAQWRFWSDCANAHGAHIRRYVFWRWGYFVSKKGYIFYWTKSKKEKVVAQNSPQSLEPCLHYFIYLFLF